LWHAHLARDFTGGTPVPLSHTQRGIAAVQRRYNCGEGKTTNYTLASLKLKRWLSSVVTNNQYTHAILDYAEQKMKWKSLQIYASQIALSNAVSFRRLRSFLKERP
jgi:hypothetical protein